VNRSRAIPPPALYADLELAGARVHQQEQARSAVFALVAVQMICSEPFP